MKTVNKYSVLALITLVSLMLLGAGSAKLAGVEELHKSFEFLALPYWFGYFIGACEIAGGIGLFVHDLRKLAAIGISNSIDLLQIV